MSQFLYQMLQRYKFMIQRNTKQKHIPTSPPASEQMEQMLSTVWANVYGIKSLGKCVDERSMVSRVWANAGSSKWYQQVG